MVPFRGSMPFLAHHLGAATAYNLNKKNSSTKSNEQLFKVINKLGKRDIVDAILRRDRLQDTHLLPAQEKQREVFDRAS